MANRKTKKMDKKHEKGFFMVLSLFLVTFLQKRRLWFDRDEDARGMKKWREFRRR